MTEPGDVPPKGDPASFVLRAKPRAVTRLSRRALVVGSVGLAGVVVVSLWWALGLRPLRVAGGPELYNTDTKPSDAVNGMSGSYAELTRPKPAPVPQALPPSPVDLGRAQASGATAPAPDPAATSGVFFAVSARQAANPLPVTPTVSDRDNPAPAKETAPAGDRPADPDTAQNLQDQKQAFLDGHVDDTIYATHRLETPRSPYQLMAGTVIAAALVTGLDSDLPGEVIAQVTEDVYDSVSGRTLLVPQGTRLLGKYDSVVAYGQERVLLAWTRLIMPDGSSVVLDNLPAANTEGYAGLEDGVDYHTWRLLKGVALSTLLGVSSELATNSATPTSGSGNISVAIRQSGDSSANQAGQNIVSKDLAIQPTLTVRPGFPVRVIVERDIVLKPYGK